MISDEPNHPLGEGEQILDIADDRVQACPASEQPPISVQIGIA
jgi:hypothetical protein